MLFKNKPDHTRLSAVTFSKLPLGQSHTTMMETLNVYIIYSVCCLMLTRRDSYNDCLIHFAGTLRFFFYYRSLEPRACWASRVGRTTIIPTSTQCVPFLSFLSLSHVLFSFFFLPSRLYLLLELVFGS